MTDGVTIRTNLPDVSRKLRELGATLSKRLVRASTAAAAQTLAKQVRIAITATTVRRSGVLARSVFIARRRRQAQGTETYRIGIRAGRTARRSKSRSGAITTLDAYYWYWVDQGHITRPAKALAGGRRTRTLQRQRIRAVGGWVEGRFFMRDAFLRGRGQAVTAFYQRFDRDFKAQVR